MALTPNEISTGASCYCLPDYEKGVLYLLDQIRVAGGGASMTPDEIADAAACYCIPDFNKAALYLLSQIQSGGGGGGGGEAGTGSPEGVVTAPPGTTYIDTAGGIFYVKFTGTGNTGWAPIV